MSCLFRKTECSTAFPPTEPSDQWLKLYERYSGFYFYMKPFIYEHRIPFKDTDMAGVVHFTSILSYAEIAEHTVLSELGIEVISSKGGFPKVHIDCDYQWPLRFGDVAIVHLSLSKCSEKSLHWQFEIHVRGNGFSGNKVCAKGSMITTYVNEEGNSSNFPNVWRDLLT